MGGAEGWQVLVDSEEIAVKGFVKGENALACSASNVQYLFWMHLMELRGYPLAAALRGKAAGVAGPVLYIRGFLGRGCGEIMPILIRPKWCAPRQQLSRLRNAKYTQPQRKRRALSGTPPRGNA